MKLSMRSDSASCVYLVCMVTCALCLSISPAFGFKILTPKEGQMVRSGETLPVTIDAGHDTGIVQVRYYWYGEQDDTLVEQEDATATGSIVAPVVLIGLSDQNPPFGGPLLVR